MPASAAPGPAWTSYKVPVEGPANLVAVAAPTRDLAWAAGFQVLPGKAKPHPRGPGDGPANTPAADECESQNWAPTLLLRRQAGGTWTRVPLPKLGRANHLSAHGSANAWLSADCGILHWNGMSWAKTPNATNPGAQQSWAGEIRAVGAAGAWLVGGTYDSRTEVSRGFVQRWDGKRWRIVRLPKLGNSFSLDSLDVRGPKDVWAVGTDYTNNQTRPERVLLLHWNGHAWKRFPQPRTGLATQRMNRVRSFGPHNVWAIGWGKTTKDGNQLRRPILLHWNGHKWATTPAPKGAGELYDLARDGKNLRAVGDTYSPPTDDAYRMLVLRWNGGRWVNDPAPTSRTGGALYSIAAIPGGGMWGTGAYSTGDLPYPTLARRN